jgi:ATP-dependent phosphofructokinase / diphosphate-dependent phosphofructokinase
LAGKRRIGILTSGGDCPGLNPVIRAVVKRGVSQLGWEVLGLRDSYNGLLTTPFRVVNLDRDSVRGILTKGGTILGTTNHGDPFHFPMKSPDGSVRYLDRSGEVVEAIRILELEGLIMVGGDGSLRIGKRMMERGLKMVAVPKTIDNDIWGTDYTFGFNTAVEVATEAIDRLHSTAESHDRVMVIEVMGRDAGWIAIHAGIAGGADVILIPEIPYDLQKICDKIRRRQAAGRFFSIVVVAEGAVEGGSDKIGVEAGTGSLKPRLGGAGAYVAKGIHERTGIETRVTVLGHLQRGGTPSGYDRLLATRMGMGATELVEESRWGEMVTLKGTQIAGVPIDEIVGQMKIVDPDGQLVRTGRGLGIEFGG